MTVTDFLLIFGAALGFSVLDLLRKILAEKIPVVPLLLWLTVGVVPLYGVWFLVDGGGLPGSGYWVPAVSSVLLNVLANLLFLRAIHLGELSRTIPLLSLAPVMTALFAIPLLAEVPTGQQGVGIVVVVIGAFLLQAEPGARKGRPEGKWWRVVPPSAWMMLAVAAIWSATTPLDKLALRSAGVPFHALFLHVGIAGFLVALLLGRGELPEMGKVRAAPLLLASAILVSAVALGAQLLALDTVMTAVLETVKRGFGGVLALVFGYLLLKERVTWAKSASIAIMVLGVGLLLL